MVWVSSEDTGTGEVTEFEAVHETALPYIMQWYRVKLYDPEPVRVRDVEDGRRVIYEGVIYRGGFGCNLWVMHKYQAC